MVSGNDSSSGLSDSEVSPRVPQHRQVKPIAVVTPPPPQHPHGARNSLCDGAAHAWAVSEVNKMLAVTDGSILKAWLQHFDQDGNHRVSQAEFLSGVKQLGYEGNATALFVALDVDCSGELTLEEIDEKQGMLWLEFRRWCSANFQSAKDMMWKLSGQRRPVKHLTCKQFTRGLQRNGWHGGHEDLLCIALDTSGRALEDLDLHEADFLWLDTEIRKEQRKLKAKQRADNTKSRIRRRRDASASLLQEFKQFLRHRYGSYLRAFRKGLSPTASMTLHKTQFLLSCQEIGWKKEPILLWQTLDKDDSGLASIDELDLREAEMLAKFHTFVMEEFGGARAAFQALDREGSKQIRFEQFASALEAYGLNVPARRLFTGLDLHGLKVICEDDLVFLDGWKPVPFLGRDANMQAMQEVKQLLANEFTSVLKSWRRLLDKSNSNRCAWPEFQAACKKLGYTGDVAGAWRALDKGLSGYITLLELDEQAHNSLVAFRKWADDQFGGVKSAFAAFDTQGSNELSLREFTRGCRVYHFEASKEMVQSIFVVLDLNGSKRLSMSDVAFLDSWDLQPREEDAEQRRSSLQSQSVFAASQDELPRLPDEEGSAADASTAAPKEAPRTTKAATWLPRVAMLPSPERTSAGVSPRARRRLPDAEMKPLNRDSLWMYKMLSSPPAAGSNPSGAGPRIQPTPPLLPDILRSSARQQALEVAGIGERLVAAIFAQQEKQGRDREACNRLLSSQDALERMFASALPLWAEPDGSLAPLAVFSYADIESLVQEFLLVSLTDEEMDSLWSVLATARREEVPWRDLAIFLYRALRRNHWEDLSLEDIDRAVLTLQKAAQKWHRTDASWSKMFKLVARKADVPVVSFVKFESFVRGVFPGLSVNAFEISDSELRGLWKALDADGSMEVTKDKFMVFLRKRHHGTTIGGAKPAAGSMSARDFPTSAVGADVSKSGCQSARGPAGAKASAGATLKLLPASDAASESEDACRCASLLKSSGDSTAAVDRLVVVLSKAAEKCHRVKGNWYSVLCRFTGRSDMTDIDISQVTNLIRQLPPGLALGQDVVSDEDIQGLWAAIGGNRRVGKVAVEDFTRFMRIRSIKQTTQSGGGTARAPRQAKDDVDDDDMSAPHFKMLWRTLDRL